MTYTKLEGWAPDLDPTTPGLLTDVTDMYPTVRGMAGRPAAISGTLPALTGTCVGSITLTKLDGTTRTFAATRAEVFEASTTSWTDRTRATGDYSGGLTTRARFAQFNDTSLLAIDGSVINQSSSGAFADISGAPVASIIETVGDFVIAFDTVDAIFGDSPNRWWCSAINNPLSWVINVATECTSGLIQATPGIVRAAHQLGEQIVVYKDDSIYVGTHVGPPIAWAYGLISENIGSFSQEAIVPTGNVHFFPGKEDFYAFDGTRPVSIGEPIRDWFAANVDQANLTKIWGQFDRANSRIVWYYPSLTGGGLLDSTISYNYRSNRWGRGSISIEAALEFVTPGIIYDNLGNAYATYQDIPGFTYDSGFFNASEKQVAIFDTTHTMKLLNGPSTNSSFVTWDIGDDEQYSFFYRFRPRFVTAPTDGSAVNSWRESLGNGFTSADAASSLHNGKFDFERSSRWHRVRPGFSGDVEITGLDIELRRDGTE